MIPSHNQKISAIFSSLYSDHKIQLWAIGGSYGIIHYTEPFETADVDVFIVLSPGITLLDVYDIIEHMGYKTAVYENKKYFVVNGVYLQIVPVSDELELEAVENAQKIGVLVVMTPEYLVALKLNAWRPKDREHIRKLMSEGILKTEILYPMLRKYNLMDRWGRLGD